jgi:hypothetical protein
MGDLVTNLYDRKQIIVGCINILLLLFLGA